MNFSNEKFKSEINVGYDYSQNICKIPCFLNVFTLSLEQQGFSKVKRYLGQG